MSRGPAQPGPWPTPAYARRTRPLHNLLRGCSAAAKANLAAELAPTWLLAGALGSDRIAQEGQLLSQHGFACPTSTRGNNSGKGEERRDLLYLQGPKPNRLKVDFFRPIPPLKSKKPAFLSLAWGRTLLGHQPWSVARRVARRHSPATRQHASDKRSSLARRNRDRASWSILVISSLPNTSPGELIEQRLQDSTQPREIRSTSDQPNGQRFQARPAAPTSCTGPSYYLQQNCGENHQYHFYPLHTTQPNRTALHFNYPQQTKI